MTTQRTPIVDKNGKQTTVHKRVDEAAKTSRNLPAAPAANDSLAFQRYIGKPVRITMHDEPYVGTINSDGVWGGYSISRPGSSKSIHIKLSEVQDIELLTSLPAPNVFAKLNIPQDVEDHYDIIASPENVYRDGEASQDEAAKTMKRYNDDFAARMRELSFEQ